MSLKVVGAGLGRTGTMSLKRGLETLLGGPCYHMYEVFQHLDHVPLWRQAAEGKPVNWDTIFDGFVAAVDWPVGSFWKEVSEHYPDSLVVLSSRDPEKWWKSASETIFPSINSIDEEFREWHDMIDCMMENRFTPDLNDKDACIAAFLKHNEDVRRNAPKGRFLEWQASEGWEPLCKALDLPIPDEPFPHVNSTEEFQQRVKDREAEKAIS
jgi:hypothetical protein